eukprot:COSAG05_NODE_75_length_21588_cov_303.091438_11_plen_109_part_00
MQELCAERWKDVDTRVVEHNIRVIAKCYSKIRSARLAMLLDKSQDETEENLSKLVVAKSVSPRLGNRYFPLMALHRPGFCQDRPAQRGGLLPAHAKRQRAAQRLVGRY